MGRVMTCSILFLTGLLNVCANGNPLHIYLMRSDSVYRFSLPDHHETFLFSFSDMNRPGNRHTISSSDSTLVWWNEQAIFSWRDGRFYRIPVERCRTVVGKTSGSDGWSIEYGDTGVNSLVVSPDGHWIAWSISTVDGYRQDETGRDSMTFRIWKSDFAGAGKEMVLTSKYTVSDVDVDHSVSWRLLRWSGKDPSSLFLASEEMFQLDSPIYRYRRLNLRTLQSDSVGYVGEVLDISEDEQLYLSSQYNGCCANGEYDVWFDQPGNGKTDLYTWSEEVGMDHPVGGEAGLFTDAGFFSPDNRYVATNSGSAEVAKVIIWSNTGKKILEFKNRSAFGWIGLQQILVGAPIDNKETYDGVFVISLDGAPEVRLIPGKVGIIGFGK